MPRYHWQLSKDISHVDLRENLQYRYAIIYPRAEMGADRLRDVVGRLQRHGLVAIPDQHEDQAVIRVRGFKKGSELFDVLEKKGLVAGPPDLKEPLKEELNPVTKTLRQYIKEHSIQLAGATYLIADMMPILSGMVRKTPSEVAQGSMWATTSAALLFFGRKNPNIQMGNIYAKMKEYLAQEGIEVPEDQALALEQLKTDPSYYNKAINFLYENPVLFNNSLQGLGGVMQVKAGTAQGNHFKQYAGTAVAMGQWGGLIVPEDKYAGMTPQQKAERLKLRAQGNEPENGFNTRLVDNPVAWVQEKPLRLSMIGPIIGNFFTAASALFYDRHKVNEYFQQHCPSFHSKQYELNPMKLIRDASRGTDDLLKASGVTRKEFNENRAQHAELEKMINTQIGWKFTMMTPVFNIIANTLYGMSSKEERSVNLDKEGYLDEVITMAANIYALVPQEQRSEKLIRFAGFLKSQPDVNINEQVIKERLEAKIDALSNSKWSEKIANENQPFEPAVGV